MALTSLKPLKSCPGATGEGGRERGGSAGRAESAGGGLRGVYKGGGRGPWAGGGGPVKQSSPPSRVIPEILKTSNGLFQKPSRSTDTRLRPVTGIILERLLRA